MSEIGSVPLWREKRPLRELVKRYRAYLARPDFRLSVILGGISLTFSLFVNFWSIQAATTHASNSVTDIILSNIPVFEVDGVFIYGTFAVIFLSVLLVFSHPKRIPFALNAVTLFILIRSAFTMFTHLGPPEAYYVSDFGVTMTKSFFGADQFFSAHTGMPFLGVLAFWKEKPFRYAFLAASIGFAAIVLIGHIHYTIDVASAFFITYGIFHIAQWLFPREWAEFQSTGSRV